MRNALLFSAAVTLLACDEAKPTSATAVVTAAASTPTASPPPPPVPQTTNVSMDENAVTVNGTRVAVEGADFRSRLAVELMGKPKIAGETVSLVTMRSVKVHKVASAILALHDAKAKDVLIKGPRRDGSAGELLVGWGDAPACSVVGAIGKDVAISVWPSSGGGPRRFAKGMAGPDMTLGSQGFEKSIAACTSTVAFLGGDDSISWGLLFDLALATKEAAKTFRIEHFYVLPEAPSAGKKTVLTL